MLKSLCFAAALASLTPGVAGSQTPVKIGVLNDRSGVSDPSGEGPVVARTAVEDFKATVPDLSVSIVSADHQDKPDVGAAIARHWYDQDKVDAIFDVPTSSVALAVKVVGSVKTPFPNADFSSFLLQAQGSKADVIAFANAGGDAINAVKQAGEFGITEGGYSFAALLIHANDVPTLTTQVAQAWC